MGSEWSGTLTHDGWSVYDLFTRAAHQQCLAHLSRRCEKLIEVARGGAVHIPRAVLSLIDRASGLRRSWRGHRSGGDELAVQGLTLSFVLEELCERRLQSQANRRLGKHILKHAMSWFWFLIDPSIQSTNHWAERTIRPRRSSIEKSGAASAHGSTHMPRPPSCPSFKPPNNAPSNHSIGSERLPPTPSHPSHCGNQLRGKVVRKYKKFFFNCSDDELELF